MRMLVPLEVARAKSTRADWRSRTDIPSAQRVKELVIRHRYIALWSHPIELIPAEATNVGSALTYALGSTGADPERIASLHEELLLDVWRATVQRIREGPVCVLHPHSQSVCVLRGTSGGHNHKHSLGRVYCIPSSLDAHHL